MCNAKCVMAAVVTIWFFKPLSLVLLRFLHSGAHLISIHICHLAQIGSVEMTDIAGNKRLNIISLCFTWNIISFSYHTSTKRLYRVMRIRDPITLYNLFNLDNSGILFLLEIRARQNHNLFNQCFTWNMMSKVITLPISSVKHFLLSQVARL